MDIVDTLDFLALLFQATLDIQELMAEVVTQVILEIVLPATVVIPVTAGIQV